MHCKLLIFSRFYIANGLLGGRLAASGFSKTVSNVLVLNTRAEVNRDSLYGMPTTVGVAQRATHAGPRRRRGGGGLR